MLLSVLAVVHHSSFIYLLNFHQRQWEFDEVFAPGVNNETIFLKVDGLITSTLDG